MNEIINQISDLEKQISDNLNLSKSKNTLKAYRSDFEDFENFCKKYSFQSLPSNPKIIGLYLINQILYYSMFFVGWVLRTLSYLC